MDRWEVQINGTQTWLNIKDLHVLAWLKLLTSHRTCYFLTYIDVQVGIDVGRMAVMQVPQTGCLH